MNGIIFDLDGTLLDSIEDIGAAMNYALQKNGLATHTRKEYESYIGNGVKVLAEKATLGKKTDVVLADYMAKYEKESGIRTKPFDGITESLLALSKRYKLAVLSNKPDRDVKILMKKYFSAVQFAVVQGHTQGYATKPDPALALKVAAEMGLKPEDIRFVGDSPEDISTGKNAKMKTAGVCWGYRSEQQLAEAGAEILVKTPYELEEKL